MNRRNYSGTSLTFPRRTPNFSSKLVISFQFDLCNQDTSILSTANVSLKGVLNREILLDGPVHVYRMVQKMYPFYICS
jgi:hypothetical protein